MKNNNNATAAGSQDTMARLSALLQQRAEDLFARILAAECGQFLQRYSHLKDELGRDAVVRNGFQPVRDILTGVGPVAVRVPKLRCRTEQSAVFHSNIVPRYVRSTQTTGRESVWRYLYGVHNCDLNQVLAALLGPQASHVAGFVPDGVRRAWLADCERKRSGTLAGSGMVELWAASIPAEKSWAANTSSMLAVMGADESGRMRLIALDHGEGDTQSRWTGVVRALLERGLHLPDRIHCAAGASAFRRALETVPQEEPEFRPRRGQAADEVVDVRSAGVALGQRTVPV